MFVVPICLFAVNPVANFSYGLRGIYWLLICGIFAASMAGNTAANFHEFSYIYGLLPVRNLFVENLFVVNLWHVCSFKLFIRSKSGS